MKKKLKVRGIATVITLVVTGTLLLMAVACTSGRDVINLPPLDLPDKGHPQLNSQLNQLVRAERNGQAASFAQQSNIDLVDGAVRVIIECVPGQLEAATEAVTNAGAKLETSYDNLLQVLVPITSLTTLADAASIHLIRLPQYPLPAGQGGGHAKPN